MSAAAPSAFARVLRAEWTKLRTVRGWMLGVALAVVLTVVVGLAVAAGRQTTCGQGPVAVACPAVPVGPDGEAVNDKFFFVHQPLTGDGSVTVRLTSLTGIITYPPPNHDQIVSGVVPWAKAGVMVKESLRQGSPYAALMLTGGHGVRMQHDFVNDTAGRPGGASPDAPRWLRLTRTGDTLTGSESSGGRRWTVVGSTVLTGLPATAQIGFFVTSPCDLSVEGQFAQPDDQCRFTEATAVFDQVSLQGGTPGGAWSHDHVGLGSSANHPGRLVAAGGTFTVTGSGDVAPRPSPGAPLESTLIGTFVGLVAVITVAALFVTAEYRRGLMRTTLLASPRRARVLVAKAVAIGTTTFVAGLAAGGIAVPIGTRLLRANGNYVPTATSLTELRVIVGVAALFAVTAVFALALGALLRRSATAVTLAIVAMVLPYLLATGSVLPAGAGEWLLRLTPAAGFAIQQSVTEYPQVIALYTPSNGYYPLAPGVGFGVLCAYTAVAFALAVLRLRRSDA
jgi:ABC-type transport system involved in multi-copper enzyme maturation permease subunit